MIKIYLSIIFIATLTFATTSQKIEKNNILVLISYHMELPWTRSFLDGLNSAKEIYPNTNYYIESLDGIRLGEDFDAELWADYLAKKYGHIKFNGAIAESDIASLLLDSHGERFLEPNTPRVYYTSENIKDSPNFLSFKGDLRKGVSDTIKVALNATKNIEKVYIVKGDNIVSKNLLSFILEELEKYPHLSIEMIEEEILDKISSKLSKIEKNSVILYALLFGNGNGVKFSPKHALSKISIDSKAPIYTFYTSLLDAGAVGGYMIDSKLIAKEMVRASFDFIYDGEFDKNYRSTNIYIDWSAAKKYKIDISAFPEDSIIINREIPIWISHRNEVLIASISLFALLVLLIAFVLLSIRLKNLNIMLKNEIKEREKQQAILIQQTKLATMGEIIQNIAHQWRQPLSAIGLLFSKLDMAKEQGKLDDVMFKKSILKGERIVQQMSQTIEDFRNFFKPNREKRDFVIQDVVREALTFMEAALEANHIELVSKLCVNEIKLHGYPNELAQVMLNLLGNAKDAIVDSKIKNGEVEIACLCQDSRVVIVVSDNGGGVPQEVVSKIFEPYFTTKEKNKGTGIGLYMSKQIVEGSMKGELSVENSSKGARFTIVLPISK